MITFVKTDILESNGNVLVCNLQTQLKAVPFATKIFLNLDAEMSQDVLKNKHLDK